MEIAKKRMQTCCFTGHRQLPAEEQEEIASRLERVIAALYQKGIPSNQSVEHEVEAAELSQLIDNFVMSLSPMERRVFICRYWYLDPIADIAQRFGFSQSKVKMMLHRQRKNLLNRLEREALL